jgi:hypothetical protein
MKWIKMSLVGAAVLLLLNGRILAVVPYPFFDGFESGSYSPNWISDGGSFTRQVTSATAAGGTYSFTLIGGASSHYTGVSASFAAAQAPATVSFSVRSASTTAADGYFSLGPSGSCPIFFFMNDKGRMYVNLSNGGDTSYSYQANVWYNIRFDIDWTNQRFNYYVNEILIKQNIPFRNAVSSVSAVYLYNFHNSQAWWDNIIDL